MGLSAGRSFSSTVAVSSSADELQPQALARLLQQELAAPVSAQQGGDALGRGQDRLDRPLQQELELVHLRGVVEGREGEDDPLALPAHRHARVADEQLQRHLAPDGRVVRGVVERLAREVDRGPHVRHRRHRSTSAGRLSPRARRRAGRASRRSGRSPGGGVGRGPGPSSPTSPGPARDSTRRKGRSARGAPPPRPRRVVAGPGPSPGRRGPGLERVGQGAAQPLRRGRGRRVQVVSADLDDRPALEDVPAGQEEVGHRSDRVEIRARVGVRGADRFRGRGRGECRRGSPRESSAASASRSLTRPKSTTFATSDRPPRSQRITFARLDVAVHEADRRGPRPAPPAPGARMCTARQPAAGGRRAATSWSRPRPSRYSIAFQHLAEDVDDPGPAAGGRPSPTSWSRPKPLEILHRVVEDAVGRATVVEDRHGIRVASPKPQAPHDWRKNHRAKDP